MSRTRSDRQTDRQLLTALKEERRLDSFLPCFGSLLHRLVGGENRGYLGRQQGNRSAERNTSKHDQDEHREIIVFSWNDGKEKEEREEERVGDC